MNDWDRSRDQVRNQVRSRVWNQADDHRLAGGWGEISIQISDQVRDQIWLRIADSVWLCACDQVDFLIRQPHD